MKQTAPAGTNRTGILTSGGRSDAMLQALGRFLPDSFGEGDGPADLRVASREAAQRDARVIGSVPPPAALSDRVGQAFEKITGRAPEVLVDKLGERLAFERTGIRLYEAVIAKWNAEGNFAGGPERADLVQILCEERAHFLMLKDIIETNGGDPTAVTPSADLAATASSGVLQIVVDPRTTLLQALEALLIAELVDCDGWGMLIAVAEAGKKKELVARFEHAEQAEQRHLSRVRSWVRAGNGG